MTPPPLTENEALTYAVILITKDRSERAATMVDQALAQTRSPDQIIVVDSSSPPLALPAPLLGRAEARGVELVVDHARPSTSAQRNRGVDLARAPVALMLDDDMIIPPDYADTLLRGWERRGLLALGGVAGSYAKDTEGSRLEAGGGRVAQLLRTIFMLHTLRFTRQTMLRRSGKLRLVPTPPREVLIRIYPNAAVLFRTDLLRKHRYDERFSGYVYGEDLDLCGRLARDAPILHSPATWCVHDADPAGRPSDEMWYRRSRHEGFFRLRMIGRDPLSLAAFGLSVLAEGGGAAVAAARARRAGPLAGYARGLREAIADVRREQRPDRTRA